MDGSITVQVRLLRAGATPPRRMSEGAAGFDVFAWPEGGEPITIAPGRWAMVGSGVALAIPAGHEGQVRPRSGLAAKHGITVLNAPGTIDADYRGELKVVLINHGDAPFVISPGDRIAQIVFAAVLPSALVTVDELDAGTGDRGTGGFGSTGGFDGGRA